MGFHRSVRLAALVAMAFFGSGLTCDDGGPPCPAGFTPAVLPGFLLGFSQTPADVVSIAAQLGANAVRPTLSWRVLEPVVTPSGLVLASVQGDASFVSQWAAAKDWSSFDARLGEMLGAGLVPIPIVGHGYTGTLPNLVGSSGPVAGPDALGREEYLARQYVVTRATVERYDGDGIDDAPGSPRVSIWQTENELNQALLTAVFGWRAPVLFDALGSAWADFAYLTRLLEALRAAVKDADPTALTTMNFHTDIRDEMMAFFGQPTWLQSVALWRFDMDVLGVDAYPNYYRSSPVRGAVVGERIAQIQPWACGMPIVVIETGYPTGPAEEGFEETKQAEYLRASHAAAVAAGAAGFLWFGARTADQHGVQITPADIANLELVASAYEQGDVGALVTFLFSNLVYVQSHFTQVLQAVEPYWGIVRPDGSHKPAWDVMAEIVAEHRSDARLAGTSRSAAAR